MRPAAATRADFTRDGKNFAPLLQSQRRRNQRSALLRRFHHYDPQRQTADQSIARGKIERQRPCADWKFRNHCAIVNDTLVELVMLRGINAIDARTQNGDGSTSGIQRSFMCRAVDTARHPAHNSKTQQRQPPTKISRHPATVIARASRAYHRNSLLILAANLSLQIEQRWWIRNHPQSRRIHRIRKRHYFDASL